MNNESKFGYNDLKRINVALITVLIILILTYHGSSFFIPLTFGIFLATLMTPFSNLLERFRINRLFSSLISAFLVFILAGVLSYLFINQLSRFAKDLPQIRDGLTAFAQNFQQSVSSLTGLSMEDQNQLIKNRSDNILQAVELSLTRFFENILYTVLNFLLVLVYLFLILLNRTRFINFVLRYSKLGCENDTRNIIGKAGKVVHQYLWGRGKVMIILAVMYYISFMIFDIKYAILLTIFGALITIIPYIGPFISGLVPILFAIIFGKGFHEVILFSSVIIVIQLIESYVLEPVIIGKEVKLRPFAVIIAVIIGGMIWGIAGMILFVPLFAMLKIVFNNMVLPDLEQRHS